MTHYQTVEDFLCDDAFIRYTLDCESEKNAYWSQFLTASASVRTAFMQATDILLHLDDTPLLSKEEVQRLKARIRRSLHLAYTH